MIKYVKSAKNIYKKNNGTIKVCYQELRLTNNLAQIEFLCLFTVDFSSLIKIRQSHLFSHFLKILKLFAMSSGSISCCSLRWFPVTDPLCSSIRWCRCQQV